MAVAMAPSAQLPGAWGDWVDGSLRKLQHESLLRMLRPVHPSLDPMQVCWSGTADRGKRLIIIISPHLCHKGFLLQQVFHSSTQQEFDDGSTGLLSQVEVDPDLLDAWVENRRADVAEDGKVSQQAAAAGRPLQQRPLCSLRLFSTNDYLGLSCHLKVGTLCGATSA